LILRKGVDCYFCDFRWLPGAGHRVPTARA
jgi:hypothetical protein